MRHATPRSRRSRALGERCDAGREDVLLSVGLRSGGLAHGHLPDLRSMDSPALVCPCVPISFSILTHRSLSCLMSSCGLPRQRWRRPRVHVQQRLQRHSVLQRDHLGRFLLVYAGSCYPLTAVVACPANAAGAPACTCSSGYSGTLPFSSGSYSGSCTCMCSSFTPDLQWWPAPPTLPAPPRARAAAATAAP